MLIFKEKEILSVAKDTFFENANFISKQNWCKNRICNGILFKKIDIFFKIINIPGITVTPNDLKQIYNNLKRGNLFDSFSFLTKKLPKLSLYEKSMIGTMLSPKHCPIADIQVLDNLSLDFSDKDFFFYANQCKFLAEHLNDIGSYTPLGTDWNVSSVDICVRYLFK